MVDDPGQLLEGQFEVVIDDHVVGHGNADGLFFFGLAEPRLDFVLGVTPAAETPLLFKTRRWEEKDEYGVGVDQFHLARAVDFDFKDDVTAIGRLG